MLVALLAIALGIQTPQADTNVTFGKVTRDLTGDAIPDPHPDPHRTDAWRPCSHVHHSGAGPNTITLFSSSPGGDRVMVIGWSAADQRFYNLLECC